LNAESRFPWSAQHAILRTGGSIVKRRPLELLIGYSFGISRSCEPGELNERIASRLAQEAINKGGSLFVGVQWEVEDALCRIDPRRDRDFVAAPLLFQEMDIAPRLDELKNVVLNDQALCAALGPLCLQPNLADIFAFPNRAVSYLNRLLHDQGFYRMFGSLALDPLRKTKNGRGWTEEREVPRAGVDLGIYQARRLNRLILESRLAPLLPVARYLGTVDVADAVLRAVTDRGLSIARVRVFGHPAHVGRCRTQTLESAWKIGLNLAPAQVDAIPCGAANPALAENWDSKNGQEWVQSWENWRQHEGVKEGGAHGQ
jgi:hypothetical protein